MVPPGVPRRAASGRCEQNWFAGVAPSQACPRGSRFVMRTHRLLSGGVGVAVSAVVKGSPSTRAPSHQVTSSPARRTSPGRYENVWLPHEAAGMVGAVIVEDSVHDRHCSRYRADQQIARIDESVALENLAHLASRQDAKPTHSMLRTA
jgi:hypothetical protein